MQERIVNDTVSAHEPKVTMDNNKAPGGPEAPARVLRFWRLSIQDGTRCAGAAKGGGGRDKAIRRCKTPGIGNLKEYGLSSREGKDAKSKEGENRRPVEGG